MLYSRSRIYELCTGMEAYEYATATWEKSLSEPGTKNAYVLKSNFVTTLPTDSSHLFLDASRRAWNARHRSHHFFLRSAAQFPSTARNLPSCSQRNRLRSEISDILAVVWSRLDSTLLCLRRFLVVCLFSGIGNLPRGGGRSHSQGSDLSFDGVQSD